MKKYLLPKDGNFYKANLHCHTTISDGRLTPEEVKDLYKSEGYSIVAYTDHDIFISHDELNDDSFLALHGVEMEVNEGNTYPCTKHRKCCHMCFIAIDPDNMTQPFWNARYSYIGNAASHIDEVKIDKSLPDYERLYGAYGVSEMMQGAREQGFFVTYNHPTWSKETYPEYAGYRGMHAMEMFNGSCLVMGYDEYNPRVYDDILRLGNRIYAIGADDNHNKYPKGSPRCDSAVAHTMIKADSLDYRAVTRALLDGSFYASEAPEIYELTFEDYKVHIKTSDAVSIAVNYMTRGAAVELSEDAPLTEATFEIPDDVVYFRLTVTDKCGKRATTNAYFLDDLVK